MKVATVPPLERALVLLDQVDQGDPTGEARKELERGLFELLRHEDEPTEDLAAAAGAARERQALVEYLARVVQLAEVKRLNGGPMSPLAAFARTLAQSIRAGDHHRRVEDPGERILLHPRQFLGLREAARRQAAEDHIDSLVYALESVSVEPRNRAERRKAGKR